MSNRSLRHFHPFASLSVSSDLPQHKVFGGMLKAIAAQKGSAGTTTADLKQRIIATGSVATQLALMSGMSSERKIKLATSFKDNCKTIWGQDAKKLETHDEFQDIVSTLENPGNLVSPALVMSFKQIAIAAGQAGSAD